MKGALFSRKTALDGGPGAMKSLGGFGREVEGDRKGDDVPILTALNGRPGACQGVGIEGWVKQGDG